MSHKILARIRLPGLQYRRPAPDSEDVKEFWRVMSARYGTTIIDKASSADMKIVANALDVMRVVDKERFLRDFATTIGTRIYLPFTPGTPVGAWDLWQQVDVCVHEHIHVVQDRRYEGIEYEWRYGTNATARAYFEVEAYRANMVLSWRYRREVLDPEKLAEMLLDYGCQVRDISMAAKMLRLSLISVKKGALPGEVIQFACSWLDARLGV